MAIKLCDEYCEGCRYYRLFSPSLYACHYTYDTDMSRGCPAGTGCVRRILLTPEERAADLAARKSITYGGESVFEDVIVPPRKGRKV